MSTWSEGLCSEAGAVEGEGGEATVAVEEEGGGGTSVLPFFDSPQTPSQINNNRNTIINVLKVKKIISLLNLHFKNKVNVREKYIKKNFYKESNVLLLSSDKSKKTLKWEPKYNIDKTMKLISDWYKIYFKKKKDLLSISQKQIAEYIDQN